MSDALNLDVPQLLNVPHMEYPLSHINMRLITKRCQMVRFSDYASSIMNKIVNVLCLPAFH